MTNKEAVNIIQAIKSMLTDDDYTKSVEAAFDMAIEALEERPDWKMLTDIPMEYLESGGILDEEELNAYDLVSRKEVLRVLYSAWHAYKNPADAIESAMKYIDEKLSSVNPPKVGRWEYYSNCYNDKYFEYYKCSECDRVIKVVKPAKLINYPYCHCGAKMEVADG